jgi:ABC-2 type transport system ATP-binding protein
MATIHRQHRAPPADVIVRHQIGGMDVAGPAVQEVAPHSDSTGAVAALRCSGLRKRFGDRQAVDGIGFEIAAGETYGLLGPNGAGKTTTISMICGILARDAGEVVVAGEPLDVGTTHAKRLVGIVPQDLAIYPDLTARENLDYFGRLYGMHGAALRSRIDEVLEVVELADRQRDRTAGYSGGMKRRLNIAIGLLHGPRLLVLDEPTVGVDPQSRNAILASVETLGREGIGILYTTHYMEEAERVCDRVGIVDQGRIIAEGTRSELVRLVGETDRVNLGASGDTRAAAEALRSYDGVLEATAREGGLDVILPEAATRLPGLLEAASRAGAVIRSVEVVEPDLEAVFLHLTGKALRD